MLEATKEVIKDIWIGFKTMLYAAILVILGVVLYSYILPIWPRLYDLYKNW